VPKCPKCGSEETAPILSESFKSKSCGEWFFDFQLDTRAAMSPQDIADLKAEGREMMRRHWDRIDREIERGY